MTTPDSKNSRPSYFIGVLGVPVFQARIPAAFAGTPTLLSGVPGCSKRKHLMACMRFTELHRKIPHLMTRHAKAAHLTNDVSQTFALPIVLQTDSLFFFVNLCST
jgi:hypothetical protein